MALLTEEYSEHQIVSILQISKMAVHQNKVKQQTMCTTKLQTGRQHNSTFDPG